MTEGEFKVTWEEFHSILRLGGNTNANWAPCAMRDTPALKRILGISRGAELIVLLESCSVVKLVPTPGSRVSQARQSQADTVPAPPPNFSERAATQVAVPLPFPPPLSRAPPKTEVPISPYSPTKPKRAFSHFKKDGDK